MTRNHDNGSDPLPLIVRVAGLPAAAMEPFSSALCAREIETLDLLREELDDLRSGMVDKLYSAIHGAESETRRFLLAVKRDCYNGKSLERYCAQPGWQTLRHLVGPMADQFIGLEEKLEKHLTKFEALYHRERDREHRALGAALDNPSFLRGVALASPLLVKNAPQLRLRPTAATQRKEKKLEVSLLRYLSRSAFKLSPYSTLTRTALGTVTAIPSGGVRLSGHPWQQRSRVCIKRHLLEPCRDMLLRYAPFCADLEIAVNRTLEELEPGRYRFMRPEYWKWDEKIHTLVYAPPTLVKVNLSGFMISWLLENLPNNRLVYRGLLETLKRELDLDNASLNDSQANVEEVLDKLLNIGFLHFQLPWSSNEADLESRLLEYLRSLPQDDGIDSVIALLDRIITLEDDYANALDPARLVEEVDSLLESLWRDIGMLVGFSERVQRKKVSHKYDLCEDVFLQTSTMESSQRDILQIPLRRAREIIRDIEPWGRFVNLSRHSHDFLHSLAALMAEKWPDQSEVGLLELFSGAQSLWRNFTSFELELRQNNGRRRWRSTFNPMNLEEVEGLGRLRETIWRETVDRIRSEAGESQIRSEDLAEILEKIPDCYAPFVGPCLFLQPADVDGESWVLNRMFEGTGRYNSRYTAVMDETVRRRYCAHQTACSVFERNGERAELLDLMCPQGDTLNVHPVMTPRILEISGEILDLPLTRRLSVRDLRVRRTQGGLPQLVDSSNRRYLPVHLGGTNLRFMPTLLKFLAHFGPGEYYNLIPFRNSREHNGVTVYDRLTTGRIVMARKRWVFSPRTLFDTVERLPEAKAYIAINQWRRARGIPEKVFMIETILDPFSNSIHKPQFIDFTSPLGTSIFCSALSKDGHHLTLEEVLPKPDAYPYDSNGERWAVELQFDTLLLKKKHNRFENQVPETSTVKRDARVSSASATRQPLAGCAPTDHEPALAQV